MGIDSGLIGMETNRLGRISAISRTTGAMSLRTARKALFVDTANVAPLEMRMYQSLNPYFFSEEWRIPVPGTNQYSHSVESIWQGLKVFQDETQPAMFAQPAYRRPLKPLSDYRYESTKFLYGDVKIDIVTARYLIYVPAYITVIEHEFSVRARESILEHLLSGTDVFVFDWDDNFEIENPNSSFSHSAILEAYFGGELETQYLRDMENRVQSVLGYAQTSPIEARSLTEYFKIQQLLGRATN